MRDSSSPITCHNTRPPEPLLKPKASLSAEHKKNIEEFSSYVTSHLIKEFYPEQNDPLLGGGKTEEIFRDLLLIPLYADGVTKQDKMGITKRIEKNLLHIQEANFGG